MTAIACILIFLIIAFVDIFLSIRKFEKKIDDEFAKLNEDFKKQLDEIVYNAHRRIDREMRR
jgi:predicted Holliday junction resolvase-like endonuclease